MNLINNVIKRTVEYIESMPKALRKSYGQFFTSKETALFMAELFSFPKYKTSISVLDPGAGSGILSVALLEKLNNSPVKSVSLVCYENDDKIIPLLKENLEYTRQNVSFKLEYEIRNDNYILDNENAYNGMLDANQDSFKFDMIIGNPPYKKISKDAHEAYAMSDICYGAPNLYFLFTEMALFNLKDDSEMVFIIPRSWTSGAYFNAFRKKMFSDGVIEHIHLFVSRNKVFEEESVLQETMIIKLRKTTIKPEYISITTTRSNRDFSEITSFKARYDIVVCGKDQYVYLVTNSDEVNTLQKLNKWDNTLPSLGLKMKTGLTVDFRNREALRDVAEETAVPLFYSQHIQSGRVIFPIGRKHEYLVTDQSGLLQKNANYLFVKRFTAKEEHRRLQCGVYLSRRFPTYNQISTQNKINFIDGLNGLSECVVYGLYVLFNSTMYDNYYRVLNGSTQVNSTEINSMPVPPMSIIESMGKELIQKKDMSEESCDMILRSYL